MNQTKRIIYIILGTVFLVLGGLGIIIPLLPTTPFWLLTCWFYIRSSERLYNKVMANRYFGSYIRAFMVDRSLTLHTKTITLSIMWISAILTSLFLIQSVLIQIILLSITVGVSFHILSFPTKK